MTTYTVAVTYESASGLTAPTTVHHTVAASHPAAAVRRALAQTRQLQQWGSCVIVLERPDSAQTQAEGRSTPLETTRLAGNT